MAYRTRQNDLVLECLRQHGGHMTAQDVIHALAQAGQAIGSATVYRRLDKLVESGSARKFVVDEKSGACYQYVEEGGQCASHSHLMCVKCGRLIHLHCDFIHALDEHILQEHGFRVDSGRTVLYGRCARCAGGEQV